MSFPETCPKATHFFDEKGNVHVMFPKLPSMEASMLGFQAWLATSVTSGCGPTIARQPTSAQAQHDSVVLPFFESRE